jgi:hypothetical protein
MQSGMYPFARRLTWLIIVVGGVAVFISMVYLLVKPDTGIVLPITRTALDAGWMLVGGLVWLGLGAIILSWLKADRDNSATSQPITQTAIDDTRLNELATRVQNLDTRLADLVTTVQHMNTQLASVAGPSKPKAITDPALNRGDLDHELGTLTTLIQEAHARLDKFDGIDSRVHDLDSQLDSLYVTLQDIHHRIDSLEEANTNR